MLFRDRIDAGRKLAQKIAQRLRDIKNPLILGLPRGGIPVGVEIARALHAPFDIFLVRKLGVPGHEELAMGAIAHGGSLALNEDIIQNLRIPQSVIDAEIKVEERELYRRNMIYRGGRTLPVIQGKSIILVDDGIATGASVRAGIAALRKQSPLQIIVAVPVAPRDVFNTLAEADDIICLATPEPFYGVGMHYADFSQMNDEDVRNMLAAA